MRRLCLTLLAAALFGAVPALRAEPGGAQDAGALSPAEISERVAALLATAPADEVRDPLEHAQLGLSRASAARRAGDASAEQRAVDIARAALALAEARAALSRERALLAAATRRGQEALRRNAASEALLEKTRARERAADAEAGEER